MAIIKSYTGYLTSDLIGTENIATGQTFTVATTPAITVLLSDIDPAAQGDPGVEVSNDPEGDQVAYIADSSNTPLVNGSEFYLELSFTFTVGGTTYTGYQFEIEGTGEDFVILPPDVPAGAATVTSRNFNPNPDEVDYSALESLDEEITSTVFTAFNFGGDDDISGGSGNDTISSEAGNDTLTGSGGDDSLVGGAGDDVLIGDGLDDNSTERLSFNWSALADPSGDGSAIDVGDDLSAGTTQDTGGIDVAVSYSDLGPGDSFTYTDGDQAVTGINSGSETINSTSAGRLTGAGGVADTSTVTFDFSSNTAAYGDDVYNVAFRVNDLDESGWRDTLKIEAFDSDGNPVTVSLGLGANLEPADVDGIPGDEVISVIEGTGNGSSTTAGGSLLVEIPGPVSQIVVTYGNLDAGGQLADITDIFFDASAVVTGDDTLDGGTGRDALYGGEGADVLSGGADADYLSGGAGNDSLDGGAGADILVAGDGSDTLTIGDGDSASGGADNDIFIITPEAGASATITDFDPTTNVSGGDPIDQSDNDFVDLSGYFPGLNQMRDAVLSTPGDDLVLDLGGGQTVTFNGVTDINLLNFENTNVICFARGTMIETPSGPRPVESLGEGDAVLTIDNGPQPLRWVGSRELYVRHLPKLHPVRIAAGALGNTADLFVSPQHRMLLSGWRAQILFDAEEIFVAAKHLINDETIRVAPTDRVEYFHLMFDAHEIVIANGAKAESLHAGPQAMSAALDAQRNELSMIFPELTSGATTRPLARRSLKGFEARALLNAG